MALQKNIITIPLGLGSEQKIDEKLVEQGKSNLQVENAVFDKIGTLKKSQSFVPVSNVLYEKDETPGVSSGLTGVLPVSVSALNKSIVVRGKAGEYAYSHENDFVLGDGRITEARITSRIIYPGTTSVDHTDCCYDPNENIILAVGRDNNGVGDVAGRAPNKSTLFIYDVATETTIPTEPIDNLSAAGSNSFGFARCEFTRVAGVSYYYNMTVDSDRDFFVKIFNKYGQKYSTSFTIPNIYASNPTNLGPVASCRNADNSEFYVILLTTTANTAKFLAFSGTTKTYETTFTYTGTGLLAPGSSTAAFDSGLIYYTYTSSGVPRRVILNSNGTVATADAAVATLSSDGGIAYKQGSILNITGGVNLFSFNGTLYNEANTSAISDSATLNGQDITVSKNSNSLDVGAFDSYFLTSVGYGSFKAGQRTIAAISPLEAINSDSDDLFASQLSRIAVVSSSVAYVALPVLVNRYGSLTTKQSYGLQLTRIEMLSDYNSNSRSQIGRNLHFSGGYLAEFDGVEMFENGFLSNPRLIAPNVASAGALTGTFSYCIVLSYTDSSGQITRSAPSSIVSSGAIVAKKSIFTITPTRIGRKLENCTVELYRTINNGTVFYFTKSAVQDFYTTNSVTIEDEESDTNLQSRPQLYTTGDVLPHDPAPACKSIAQGGNRLILGGLEDEDEIAFSKKKLFGEAVNFSDFFRIRIDTSQYNISGGVTAVGYMDDKIIVFKRNSIFYISGDGPNELGANDSFISPELITSETGCTEPRSVVLSPLGIMFKGEKGIYLLSRGLQSQYVGSGIEDYNDHNCAAAVHVDKKNLVVFTLVKDGEGVQAKFDYLTQQWAVITNKYAIDADLVDGNLVILNGDTLLPEVQNGTDFANDGTEYSLKVITPWIKLSGLQDFSRIRSVTILGKYKSAHDLKVNVRYDYDEDDLIEYTITPEATDDQYQYRIHLERQKCEAIQFEIFDENQTGEAMELTALSLEVAMKSGTFKLNAGRKY